VRCGIKTAKGCMNMFRFPRPISSAPVARKRLQTLLEYERGRFNPDLFTVLREEILTCISRYVTFDPDDVQLKVDRGARVSGLSLELTFPT
jgi:cell division topological specificity factor